MILSFVRTTLTTLGTLMANPLAFAIVAVYAALWWGFERNTFDWHAVATIAVWMMTLFIQRAEHRDTQAIHGKLDELLRVHGAARNELTHLDEGEPEEIEQRRQAETQASA